MNALANKINNGIEGKIKCDICLSNIELNEFYRKEGNSNYHCSCFAEQQQEQIVGE